MIIDCFTFNADTPGELDILEARLQYLWNHVSLFVLLESNLHPVTGVVKPFHFQQNLDRFKFYTKKIIYHPYYYYDNRLPVDHHLEQMQTTHVISGLSQFPENALVMFSDVTSMPNLDVIGFMNANAMQTAQCIQNNYLQDLDSPSEMLVSGTYIVRHQAIRQNSMQWFNEHKSQFPKIYNGGWKFSNFNSPIRPSTSGSLTKIHPALAEVFNRFIKG